jgi:uncharacterized membrane protein YphA (DoxX/SURF4 family)
MSEQPGLLRRMHRNGWIVFGLRLGLGLLFLAMGLAKTGTLKEAAAGEGVLGYPVVQKFTQLGWVDLASPVDFMKVIREYHLVPEQAWWLLNATAVMLPWIEVLCGLLLILGIATRGAALTLLIMLLVFTPAVAHQAITLYQTTPGISFCAVEFNCGCGAGVVNACSKLTENALLIIASLYVLLSSRFRLSLAPRLVPAGIGTRSETSAGSHSDSNAD